MKRSSLRNFLVILFCAAFGITPAIAQNDNPTGKAGMFNGNSTTAEPFDPYTANAGPRTIVDLSVPGAQGSYGLQWTRTMNSRRVEGPNYDFGDAGSWQHAYGWGIDWTTNPVPPNPWLDTTANSPRPLSYIVYYPDGRVVEFQHQAVTPPDPMYRGPAGVTDRFQPVAGSGFCYLLLSDGGKVEFQQNGSFDRQDKQWSFDIYPTAVIDPYGQRTTLTYGAGGLIQVTEPAGRWLKINYTLISNRYVISSVQGGYGYNTVTQSVTYSYQQFTVTHPQYQNLTYTYTTLTGVSYSDGTSAAYTYQRSNTYPNTGPPLIQTCDDVRYPGPMKKIAYEFIAQPDQSVGGIYGEFGIARKWLYPAPRVVSYWLGGHVETRGDGPQRFFTYGPLATVSEYSVPQPYLLSSYTNFKGSPTYLGYDANTFVSAVQDANGNVTRFTRTFTGKIASVIHPPDPTGATSTVQYSYTDPTYGYYLQSVTDELGHTTAYQRDGNNRIKEIDYPDGASEIFTYANYGQVQTHKMTSGGTETFEYDYWNGLRQAYRDPYHASGNPTVWYQYDGLERVSGVTDSRGSGPGDVNYTTKYEYNQRGQLTKKTHPYDAAAGERYTVVRSGFKSV